MRPFIFLIFAFLPLFVSAGLPSISQFIKQAEVIKVNAVTSVSSTAIKVSTMVRGFAANDPYMVKNIDVPKANFMSHLKSSAGGIGGLVKKNAWYAGWFAAMAAAGWAIDELTGQMTKPTFKITGSCFFSGGNQFAFGTPQYCAAEASPSTPLNLRLVSGKPAQGADLLYTFEYVNPSNNVTYSRSFYLRVQTATSTVEPVPDDALYDSLASEMLKDPQKAAQAFMVPDAWPYPYPQIFPETVPYIPGVSEADQEALDLYYRGLLQSTDPNAPYYVTPERYQQIAALAQQLQQGQTPEGQQDALNDQLKKPLTQKELEETLKKRDEEAAKEAESLKAQTEAALEPAQSALEKLAEDNTWLEQQITSAPSNQPPVMGFTLPKWVWPTGNCRPIPIIFEISNLSAKANDNGAFCDFYNDVAHPLIYWFMYMLLALYLFVLWNKTMVQVIGAR
ncbi:DUF883 domain-containing protein [Aeromonas enteropelogenes]|uniref:DUF883 domain-containing protein n=1 Tax=Aeromonas enteropelogenes TaxID=29489 RepID=UPI000F532EC0|nr:hypothetical protein [Aeromonas enteropelogenes]RQM71371.1 hypothetical protein EHZ64_00135 [Aeromonas enteropelogenes]